MCKPLVNKICVLMELPKKLQLVIDGNVNLLEIT